MIKHFLIGLIAIFFISCDHNNQQTTSSDDIVGTSSESESSPTSDVSIDSIEMISGNELILKINEQKSLFLNVHLSNGKIYHNIKNKFQSIYPHLNENVIWYSNNENIVSVSKFGRLQARQSGSTTIIARLQTVSVLLSVSVPEDSVFVPEDMDDMNDTEEAEENNDEVIVATEEPDDVTDAFLNSNDVFTDDFSVDAGFGYESFPNILYGAPVDVFDVVSFGMGGELKIELNGYVIMDGVGADFTIFENPFPGWQECAEVSVSEDDVTYHTYSCNQFDASETYEGCAGVNSVNYGLNDGAYLDPSLSGGDQFDLADLSGADIEFIKFIKITDIGLCKPEETEGGGNPGGFDLDAIAIINGINE